MSHRTRLLATVPLLVVSDLQRALDFYTVKLGFIEPAVHGDPPCFAMLNRDGFDLMLSVAEGNTRPRPNGPGRSLGRYLRIADVGKEAEALTPAGVPIARGPTDTFYGIREIEVLDPDSYRWCLGRDVSGEAWRGAETWEGLLEVPPGTHQVALKIAPTAGGLAGLLDSPDQGLFNLPIDALRCEARTLHFEMASLGARSEGTLSDDGQALTGTWSQHGRSRSLSFTKAR